MLGSLRLDLALREVPHHLAERGVLLGRVEEICHGTRSIRSRRVRARARVAWPARARAGYSHVMRPRVLAVVLLVVHASLAGACPELPIPPDAPNAFDLQYGATNVNAALGSGRLTAAFSRCGELTVLKWPGPSYHNQLDYLSSNAPDARTLPHFGALDGQGAFPGIAYRLRGGRRGFTWLRDDGWSHAQRYSADSSDVLVDEAVNAELGLRVTARSFVLPDRNVLVDHYEVRRDPGSPVRAGTLLFYTNLQPTLARLPYFNFADWALDFRPTSPPRTTRASGPSCTSCRCRRERRTTTAW